MESKTEIKSKFNGSVLRIFLDGEIDHHSAAGIRADIDREILNCHPERLALDFSSVSLMDSSGLGLIMGRYNLMRELGGEVIIENPNPATDRIIRLGGIERIVKIIGEPPIPSKRVKKRKQEVNAK